ncbi:MAG: SPASM domain-containing protein [bacterium]|nr:SPASM domain-containing protein [bacterium]
MYLLGDFDRVYAMKHGLEPIRPLSATQRPMKPCSVAFDNIAINPDGTVNPCCRSWYIYGNLIESDFMSVWNSDAAYKFRKRMLNMDFRDCLVACDTNAKPINQKLADARKAYWIVKRNPKSAVKKGLRRLGLSSAQIDLPEEMKPKALTQQSAKSDEIST